jgi:hypothetical protein
MQIQLSQILEQIWMPRVPEMALPGFQFQNFSEGVRPQTPLFMRGMSATRGFQSLLSLSNISSHR